MIDPFVSLFMPQDEQGTHNDASNIITVEEAIDCRDANSRFFNLLNKETQLSFIINDNSNITSCSLAGHEIVVDKNLYHETHETWAIGERPFQRLSGLSWNSHVRGSELILSSSTSSTSNNPQTSLHFDLTRSNELHCLAKLKSIHLQHQVFYYNLNRALGQRTPIDGHTIVVRCNGSLSRIQAQSTKLLCHCNKSSPMPPLNLIGNIPIVLCQHPEDGNSDDLILCDAIYSLETQIGSPDYLQAQLQFTNRILTFEVRSAKSTPTSGYSSSSSSSNNNNNNNNNNPGSVSSSSSSSNSQVAPPPSQSDLRHLQAFANHPVANIAGGEASRGSASCPSDDTVATSSSTSQDQIIARMKVEPLDSTSTSSSCNRSSNVSPSGSQSYQPSTWLRIRIRITNFGICILPIMMTNYASKLSFNVI